MRRFRGWPFLLSGLALCAAAWLLLRDASPPPDARDAEGPTGPAELEAPPGGPGLAGPARPDTPGAAPPPPRTGPARFHGRVLGPDGRGVGGVPLALLAQAPDPAATYLIPRPRERPGHRTLPEVIAHTHSDADGRFAFAGLPASLWATLRAEPEPPLCPTEQSMYGDTYAEVRLRPGVPVRLHAVDAQGQGLPALVSLEAEAAPGPGAWRRSDVATDGDGRLELAAVPPGRLLVTLHVPGRGSRLNLRLEAPGEGVTRLWFEDPQGAAVAGRVRTASGAPVPDVLVTAVVRGAGGVTLTLRGTPTDAQGAYRISGLAPGVLARVAVEPPAHPAPPDLYLNRVLTAGQVERLDVTLPVGGTVQGRVVGPGEQPVAGALVEVVWLAPGSGSARQAQASSGPDGTFRVAGVALGTGYVHALAPGWYVPYTDEAPRAPYHLAGDGAVAEVTVRLLEGVAVRGRVVDEAGAPVPGARIEARGRPRVTWSAESPVATSDAEGRFVLPGLPPLGPWVIEAVRDERVGRLEPLELGSQDTVGEVTIVLRRGASIAGVVQVDGAPPGRRERVAVKATGDPHGTLRTIVTDPEGRFSCAGLAAGPYRLECLDHDASPCGEPLDVLLAAGERREGLVLVGAPLGDLRGVVVDADGRPRAGAKVEMRALGSPGPSGNWLVTGADGAFAFGSLRAGEWHVLVDGREITVARTGSPPLRLEVPGGEETILLLRVLAPDGSPLPLGQATAAWAVGPSMTGTQATIFEGAARLYVPASAAEEGVELTIGGACDAQGRPLNARKAVHRVASPGPHEIRLEAGSVVAGTVTDPQGRAVPGASVRVGPWPYFPGHRSGEWPCDPGSGAFEAVGLDPGRLRLQAAAGPEWTTHTIEVDAGTTNLRIVLEPAAHLAGRVVDPQGRGVAGATVRLAHGADSLRGSQTATSQADGAFVLRGLPPRGPWGPLVAHPPEARAGDLLATTIAAVDPGAGPVVLALGQGARLRGEIVAEGGLAPSARGVYLHLERLGADAGPASNAGYQVHGPTFDVGPLAPGRWRLRVQAQPPHRGPEAREIEVPTGDLRILLTLAPRILGEVVGPVAGDLGGWFIQEDPKGRLRTPVPFEGRRFEFLPPSEAGGVLYVSEADGDGFALATDVRPSPHPLRLALQAGRRIAGRIEPAPGARGGWVKARSPLGFSTSAPVDAQGAFVLRALPPGTYDLYAFADGGPSYDPLPGVEAGATGVRVVAR